MGKRIIAIDLDDTLNCLKEKWIDSYNYFYDDNLKPEDITDWDWTKFVKPECGQNIYKFLFIPGFFRDLGIKPYAQKVIPWLQQYFDIYILSAAHYLVTKDKGEWLNEFLPSIPYENIVFCTNKSLFKADYFIDDGLHNLEVVTGKPLLFHASHNQHDTKFPRFYNWLEIKEYFETVTV
jgi:5'(3')-deoxyribonucleotidase